MATTPSQPELAALAAGALAEYIEALASEPRARPFGLVRRIAFVCLYFMYSEKLGLKQALDASADLYRGSDDVSSAYFRKCKSEAKAMVFEVVARGGLGDELSGPLAFFRAIERAILEASLADATRRRAGELKGSRGGPKAKTEMTVLRAVRQLAERARKGDHRAAAELELIGKLLGTTTTAE